jgi:NitT/TauT family transport system substrate-binding protein
MMRPNLRYTRAGSLAVLAIALGIAGTACSSSGGGTPADASGSSAGASGGGALLPITYAGPTAPNGIAAQMAYGQQEGIFKKYGFDLKIVYPANTATAAIIPDIANGTFTISTAQPTAMMQEYEAGVKTTGIFGFLVKNPTGITMNKKAGVATPQQLKGKTLGVSTGSANIEVTPKYLAHYGLSESDVKVVTESLAALPGSLISGQIDGIIAFPYAIDPQVNAKGVQTNDLLFNQAGINEMQQVFAVGNSWMQAHESVMPNLVKALEESTEGAIKDPDEAAKDLIATAPATAPSQAVTKAQWLASVPFMTTPNTQGHPIGYMAPEDWQETLKYAETYLSAKPMNPALVYTDKYISGS